MDNIFELDINSLTIGEIEEIEDLGGQPIDSLFSATGKKGKALRAIAFVMKRRENPDFTWEEAGDLRINLSGDEQDPTSPED
jgi:hypothetical protein